jgi:hypothetical protein
MAHRPDCKLLTGGFCPSYPSPVLLCSGAVVSHTWTRSRGAARNVGRSRSNLLLAGGGARTAIPTGDVRNVGLLYEKHQLNVALVNGLFGYGLNRRNGQDKAIAGIAHILKPGDLLMLGWNTHRTADPSQLQRLK